MYENVYEHWLPEKNQQTKDSSAKSGADDCNEE